MKASITIAVIALHLAIVATILVPGCTSSTENAELNPEVTSAKPSANATTQTSPATGDDTNVAILNQESAEGSEGLRANPLRPVIVGDVILGTDKSGEDVEKIEPKTNEKAAINEEIAGSTTYIVKKGDTLSKIAAKNGVNLSILMEANGMNRKSIIKVGQKITIPAKSAKASSKVEKSEPVAPTASGDVVTYVVQKGDNLSKIASKYRTSVAAIMELNGMTKTSINIGKKLKIPTNSKADTAPATDVSKKYEGKITHTVKAGDTLGGISIKYGVPLKTLMAQNNISDARKVRIGKVLIIKDKPANTDAKFVESKKVDVQKTEVVPTTPVAPAPSVPVVTTPAPEVPAPVEPVEKPEEIPAEVVNTATPQPELPSL